MALSASVLAGCSDEAPESDLSSSALPLTGDVCTEISTDELRLVLGFGDVEFQTTTNAPGDGSVVCEYQSVVPSTPTTSSEEVETGFVRIAVLRSARARATYDKVELAAGDAKRLPGVGDRAMVTITPAGIQINAIGANTYIVALAQRSSPGLLSEPLGALVKRVFERVN
jgi:hypothetical protein